jgi:hypothetical protein
MASVSLSIAVGAGDGAVKGWTATSGGSVDWRIVMQFVVIDSVALGFIRRMLILDILTVVVSETGVLVRFFCDVVIVFQRCCKLIDDFSTCVDCKRDQVDCGNKAIEHAGDDVFGKYIAPIL